MDNKFLLKIKKINQNAIIPKYATDGAVGADLCACIDDSIIINPGETAFIGTGLSVAIPDGIVGLVYARSGLSCKNGLAPANKVGVIDNDYRGEIIVALHNHSQNAYTVSTGDRIAQILFMPYYAANFELVDELTDTVRGIEGFGSTGDK